MRRGLGAIESAYIEPALRGASWGPEHLIPHALARARIHHYWPGPRDMKSELMQYAVQLGRQGGAIAVTIGDDVYFDPNFVDTSSIPVSLVAHEITHVLQAMREGGFETYAAKYLPGYVRGEYTIDPYEIEAGRVAQYVIDMMNHNASHHPHTGR